MFIIYEPDSRKIICWAEEGQNALYPTANVGQIESRLDCTVEEFENACRESSGDWTSEGVGPNYLHESVEDATKSKKTSKPGKKIGHKAVECEHQDNVPDPTSIADKIESNRKAKGKRLDDPITLQELREAERALAT